MLQTAAAPTLFQRTIESPIGDLLAIATGDALTLLEFTNRRALPTELRDVRAQFGAEPVEDSNAVLDQTARELDEYFNHERTGFTIPLTTHGTPFQRAVWDELCAIPCGKTRTYGEMAERLGKPGGSRAVGRANGANRIGIVIPCHRVIRTGGDLGGYGGKLWRKQWLLEHEGARIAAGAGLFED
ncbi:MAG: methylated-DNA--[protein]-cysteine S-methyltransferase [Phycisphaeraceae bacterium]|nr:methylated-DNA--[protein]-cysteine S-methyltransferase [Phycisphaeraceae bacterium]